MPQAVTHILFPLILTSIFRDLFVSRNKSENKKKFSSHYVLVAGIGGLLPDLDVAAFWILHFFGFTFEAIHRTFAHSVFIPFIFLLLYIFLRNSDTNARICNIGRHKLKLHLIFIAFAFGSFTHLLLDGTLSGVIAPFYPLSTQLIGLNLFGYFPDVLELLAAPTLDAALLIIWIIYLELKHKISDFI